MQLKKIWWCFAIIFPIYVCKYDISYMISVYDIFFHIIYCSTYSTADSYRLQDYVQFHFVHYMYFFICFNTKWMFKVFSVSKSYETPNLLFESQNNSAGHQRIVFFFLIRFIYNYLLITLFYYMYEITFCWIVYKVFQDLKYKYIESQALTRTLAYSPD